MRTLRTLQSRQTRQYRSAIRVLSVADITLAPAPVSAIPAKTAIPLARLIDAPSDAIIASAICGKNGNTDHIAQDPLCSFRVLCVLCGSIRNLLTARLGRRCYTT